MLPALLGATEASGPGDWLHRGSTHSRGWAKGLHEELGAIGRYERGSWHRY